MVQGNLISDFNTYLDRNHIFHNHHSHQIPPNHHHHCRYKHHDDDDAGDDGIGWERPATNGGVWEKTFAPPRIHGQTWSVS